MDQKQHTGKSKEALNVYEQRFLMMMKLIKIDRMLKNATIIKNNIKD